MIRGGHSWKASDPAKLLKGTSTLDKSMDTELKKSVENILTYAICEQKQRYDISY